MSQTTPKNLTLEDIARMAGVSRATVSRVINNQVGSRCKARNQVLKIIAETGFQPHAAARSLVTRRSNVIGLVIPAPASHVLTEPYLLQLTEVIAQACNDSDHILSLFLTEGGQDEQKLFPKITRKGTIDGLIVRVIQGRRSDPLLQSLAEAGIPFVVTGRPTNPEQISYVSVDNVSGAYKAVSHLIGLGRRRIGLITGSMESYPNLDRLEGYRRALREGNLPEEKKLISAGGFTENGGYEAARHLLQYRPDAIFVVSDRMALGVLRALREAGIRTPEDVAVVGFDDLPLAMQAKPALTTVRQPLPAMGKRLVALLFDVIEHGPNPPRHVIFETELIIRESCGGLKL